MRVDCDQPDSPVWRVRLAPSPSPGTTPSRVALDAEGLSALLEVLDAASASACRVVVLESEEQVFCAGMDLAVVRAKPGADQGEGLKLYASCMHRLATLPLTTVCLVDGDAIGGGVGLAAAVDCLMATRRARFRLPELGFGLLPAMVLPLLRRRLVPQKARWMALSGQAVGAERALELGLVDRVVDDDAGLEVALRGVLKGLLRQSPAAVARLIAFEAEIDGIPLAEALGRGAERTREDLLDETVIAAIDALSEGELPPWFSRYKPPES
jgi:enoyl-CoA hydratase/carnithine racemase